MFYEEGNARRSVSCLRRHLPELLREEHDSEGDIGARKLRPSVRVCTYGNPLPLIAEVDQTLQIVTVQWASLVVNAAY